MLGHPRVHHGRNRIATPSGKVAFSTKLSALQRFSVSAFQRSCNSQCFSCVSLASLASLPAPASACASATLSVLSVSANFNASATLSSFSTFSIVATLSASTTLSDYRPCRRQQLLSPSGNSQASRPPVTDSHTLITHDRISSFSASHLHSLVLACVPVCAYAM